MTIKEIQDEIIDDFELTDDWMERYEMIIEMGNDLPPFPDEEKTPEHIIEGCQSRVWVVGHPQPDGTIHYEADSDAIIQYLKGQTLNVEGEKGWYLISVDGYSIGWGKQSGGIMKNHYPKGLRRV